MKHIEFFDCHTHVQFAAFDDDRDEIIQRARAAGVGMVNVGTQKDTSLRAVELAHEFEGEPIYAAVGLHPIHTSPSFHDEDELGPLSYSRELERVEEAFDLEYYRKLAEDPKVVAIGECGLEYFHLPEGGEEEAKRKQKEAFIAQMELAHEVGKPLMIHCRNAYADLLELLSTHYQLLTAPSIIHFFAGTIDEAKEFLDLGFSFTFGGAITFPPRKNVPVHPNAHGAAGDYAAAVAMLPIERILSETDAPYITPVPYRGKRNEPLYVTETVKKLAEIKNIPVDAMAHATVENAKRVFKIG